MVNTDIGNTQCYSHPPYDWKFGKMIGTCDGKDHGSYLQHELKIKIGVRYTSTGIAIELPPIED